MEPLVLSRNDFIKKCSRRSIVLLLCGFWIWGGNLGFRNQRGGCLPSHTASVHSIRIKVGQDESDGRCLPPGILSTAESGNC